MRKYLIFSLLFLILISALVTALPQYANKHAQQYTENTKDYANTPATRKISTTPQTNYYPIQNDPPRRVTPAGLCKQECSTSCSTEKQVVETSRKYNKTYADTIVKSNARCIIDCFQEKCIPAPKAYGVCSASKDGCCNMALKTTLDPDCVKITSTNNETIQADYTPENNTLTVRAEELTDIAITVESPITQDVNLRVIGEWPVGTWLHILTNKEVDIGKTIQSPFSSETTINTTLVEGTNDIVASNNLLENPYFESHLPLPLDVLFFTCYLCPDSFLKFTNTGRFTPDINYIESTQTEKYDGLKAVSYNFTFDTFNSDQFLRTKVFQVTPGNYTLTYYYKFSDDFSMPQRVGDFDLNGIPDDFINSLWIQLDLNVLDPNLFGENSHQQFGYDFHDFSQYGFGEKPIMFKELMLNISGNTWVDENVFAQGFQKLSGVDEINVTDLGNGWNKLTISNINIPISTEGLIMTYPYCYDQDCYGNVYVDAIQFTKQDQVSNLIPNPSFEEGRPEALRWHRFDCYECSGSYLDFSVKTGVYPGFEFTNLTGNEKYVVNDSYQWNLNLNPENVDDGILRSNIFDVTQGTYSLFLYYKTSSDYSVIDGEGEGLWLELDLSTNNPLLASSETGWKYYASSDRYSVISQEYAMVDNAQNWDLLANYNSTYNVKTITDKGNGWREFRVDNIKIPIDTQALLMTEFYCFSQNCTGKGYFGGASLIKTL